MQSHEKGDLGHRSFSPRSPRGLFAEPSSDSHLLPNQVQNTQSSYVHCVRKRDTLALACQKICKKRWANDPEWMTASAPPQEQESRPRQHCHNRLAPEGLFLLVACRRAVLSRPPFSRSSDMTAISPGNTCPIARPLFPGSLILASSHLNSS